MGFPLNKGGVGGCSNSQVLCGNSSAMFDIKLKKMYFIKLNIGFKI